MSPPAKLPDRIYEVVLGRIISGQYEVDSRLPSEIELANALGVSRPVVRDALERLRVDGLIVSRRGSGSYVRRRPDQAVATFAPVGSIADISRCFAFRTALEGEAAAAAAEVQDADGMTVLRSAYAGLELILTSGQLGVEEDVAFHRAVAAATGNHFFVAAMESLQQQIAVGISLNRNLSLLQPQHRLQVSHREHTDILRAIEAGEPDRARAAMRTHLANARQRVFEGAPDRR